MAKTAHSTHYMTVEEFARLPDDGSRMELVRGKVVREPPAGFEHGRRAGSVGIVLGRFVRKHGLGTVLAAETGFILREDPPTVRAADAAFVRAERIPAEPVIGFAPFAPDLAVEVLSPSNTLAEVQEKVLDYLDAGTEEVWIVDPAGRTLTVYRSRSEIRMLVEGDVLDGGQLLPGFRVTVGELLGV